MLGSRRGLSAIFADLPIGSSTTTATCADDAAILAAHNPALTRKPLLHSKVAKSD